MEDYTELKNMLKPRCEFAASDELRNRIGMLLKPCTPGKRPFRWIWGVCAFCVAAAVLVLILIPTGMSAKEILAGTLDALLNAREIEMTVEIRTRPMENFRYINLQEDFVEHDITIVKSDSTLSWRIDKDGRTAIGNNEVIYNWIDRFKIGWRTDNANPEALLGEMAVLLTPEKILESELRNCIDNAQAHYDVEKKDGNILLTIHSNPQGDLSNPYMLNASIAESENIRCYVIDSATKRLKSASVCIINGKSKTEVLKITDIVYGKPHSNIASLPPDIRFIDMPGNTLRGLTGLTATEAALVFLNALETWNVSILDITVDENVRTGMYEQDLKGSVLVSVGKSFNSGNEGTTFVPYVLQLPDGTLKRHNLALQKSSQGGWIVAGGL